MPGILSGGNSSSIKENYMSCDQCVFPEAESTKNTPGAQTPVHCKPSLTGRCSPAGAGGQKGEFDTLYESMKEGASQSRSPTGALGLFRNQRTWLEAAAMYARKIWRESRFELMEDKFVVLLMFLNRLPFCTDRDAARDLFRYKIFMTNRAGGCGPAGVWNGRGTDPSLSADSATARLRESVSSRHSNTNKTSDGSQPNPVSG